MTSIEAVESVPEFGMLSEQLRQPLLEKKAFLEVSAAAANVILDSNDDGDLPDLPSSADVMDAVANVKKVVVRITNVLAAIARLHH
jgi:hypothetical protein